MEMKPTDQNPKRRSRQPQKGSTAGRSALNETIRELQRLKLAVDAAGVGVWELDLRQNRLIWDERMYAIYGIRPGDFEGAYEAWKKGVHPEDLPQADAQVQAAVEGKKEFHSRFRVVRPDGEVRHIEAHAVVLRDEDGTPHRMVGTNVDITEGRRAVEALSENEQFLQSLFDAIQDGINVLDRNYTNVRVNAWMENIFRHKGDLIGKKCYEVYQERSSVCPWCPSRKAFETGHTHSTEVPYPSANNPDGWLDLSAFPLKDADGQVVCVIEYLKDITEHKQAVEALQRSEAQLRLFIEHTPAAVAVCDRQMRYLAHSRRWIEDYQLPEENLIGRSHYEVFQTIPEKWKEEHERCFAGEVIEKEEEPFPRADGSQDWVRRKVYPWRDASGEIRGLIMFTEVVTDRIHAKNALAESEEKYRILVENATDAIFIAQDESIKFPNKRALELLDCEARDVENVPFVTFIHPDDRDRVLDIHRRRLSGEQGLPNTYSFRVINRSGQQYLVELTAVIIEWEGRPATLSFVRDLTEQKKMEASLKQAQKMEAIGTLAGGIAHDFNNILMGIQGRVSLMLADADPEAADRDHLHGIEDYIRSATALTKQLLGFARGGKYEVKTTNPNDLVTKTAELFGRTRKEINIHSKLQEDIWAVEADRGQIEQVLLNLFVNAWQAMPGGGTLFLQSQNTALDETYVQPFQIRPGRYVKISITDTGIGMDAATREKIFDPFFTTKEMGRGTGLGLASVYGIVKNHHGFINVYSEKGKGSTFNIYLPASDKSIDKETQPVSRPQTGTETVLLVDDEEMITEVGKAMLEHLGYSVCVAGSGEEAVESYRNHHGRIDLVILDMIMPGMNGGQTYDRLKQIDPAVKVLLSSGYSINGEASDILARGCSGFIQKPFNLIEMSRKIRKVLDR